MVKKFKDFLKAQVSPDYTIFQGKKYFNIFASIGSRPSIESEEEQKKLEEKVEIPDWQGGISTQKFSPEWIGKARSIIEKDTLMHHEHPTHKALSQHYSDVAKHWDSLHASVRDYTVESELLNRALWSGDHGDWKDQIKGMSNSIKQFRTPSHLLVYSGINRSPERYENFRKQGQPHRLHLKSFTSTSLDHRKAMTFSGGDPESIHTYHRRLDKNGEIKRTPVEEGIRRDYFDWNKRKHWGIDMTEKPDHIADAERKHGPIDHYRHVLQIHVPKGSHGIYVGHVSAHQDEFEHILHHGALIDVHHKPTLNHKQRAVYWHARLVHDGVEPTLWAR